MRTGKLINFFLLGMATLFSSQVFSAEGGYSNYVPGTYGDFGMALAPVEKWTFRNDLYFYDAEASRAVRNGNVQAGLDLTFVMNFSTLLYKTDFQLFGGTYAAGVFLPLASLDIDTNLQIGNTRVSADDSDNGVGDIAFIPVALFWNEGNLHTAFTQTIVAPTGDYDVNNSINTGLNYWSFDTNYALTHLNPETGYEFSLNIGHIYNTENTDTNYQTGREIHLDAAFNMYLSETLAIGVHGFHLEQYSDDTGSGAVLGDFKARVTGFGPAVLWSKQFGDQNVSFIGKWLHEFNERNRISGDHLFFSFAFDL